MKKFNCDWYGVKIYKKFYIINFLMLLIIISLRYFEYEFMYKLLEIIGYIVYFVVTILGTYSIRNLENKKVKAISIVLLPVLYILTCNIFLAIPICFLFFTRPTKFGWLYYILLTLMSIILWFGLFLKMLLSEFSADEIIAKIESPNEKYTAVHIRNNQGALGGANIVEILTEYKFIGLKRRKQVYEISKYGADIEMKWISDDVIEINGQAIHF